MSGYTRQQSYIDGDVILAEHTNDEFDLLAEVFDTTLGHKHDGTAAEGPTISLLSDDDNDTTIEVERTADDDTIYLKTAGTDRVTVSPTGSVGIGTSSPLSSLHVEAGNPTFRLQATATNNAPKLEFFGKDSGDVGHNSSFDYKSTSELQIHADATNTVTASSVTIYVDGTRHTRFNASSQLVVEPGTVSLPSLTFNNDTDTGIYRSAANTINLVTGGVSRMDINSSGNISFTSTTVTAGGNTVWHAGNDGAGSGLAADTVDGYEGAQLAVLAENETITGQWDFDNHIDLGNNINLRGKEVGGTTRNLAKVNGSDIAEFGGTSINMALTALSTITAGATLVTSSGIQNSVGSVGSPSYTFSGDTNTGIARPAADTLTFSTAGSEIVRVDSSGNVGIGTGSGIDTKLHVQDGNPTLKVEATSTSNAPRQVFQGVTSGAASFEVFEIQTRADGDVELRVDDTSSGGSGSLEIYTANTLQSTVNANGHFFFGTTSDLRTASTGLGAHFNIGGVGVLTIGAGPTANALIINKTDYVSGNSNAASFRLNGTTVGSITLNGSTTTYNTSSDYRLKENVVDLTNATERMKQLKAKRFNFIGQEETIDGFIAHEVQEVVPEAVQGEKDGEEYQQMDASKLIPLLVATIQELEARVATLEGVN